MKQIRIHFVAVFVLSLLLISCSKHEVYDYDMNTKTIELFSSTVLLESDIDYMVHSKQNNTTRRGNTKSNVMKRHNPTSIELAGSGLQTFYSYLPLVSKNEDRVVPEVASGNGYIFKNYEVPADNSKQEHLMYAIESDLNASAKQNKPIDVTYKHALTTVEFKVSVDTSEYVLEVAPNGLTLHNIVSNGTFSVAEGFASWTSADKTAWSNYTAESEKMVFNAQDAETKSEANATKPLILLPQRDLFEAWNADIHSIAGANEKKEVYLSMKIRCYCKTLDLSDKIYSAGSETSYSTVYIPISTYMDGSKKNLWKAGSHVTYHINPMESARNEMGGRYFRPIEFEAGVGNWVEEESFSL